LIIKALIEIDGDLDGIDSEEAGNILDTIIQTGCESYHLDGKVEVLEIISL